MGLRGAIALCYQLAMRSFKEIVEQAGDDVLADRLGVKRHQPRDWRIRDSIPAEYWEAVARHRFATLSELAAAAASRRAPFG